LQASLFVLLLFYLLLSLVVVMPFLPSHSGSESTTGGANHDHNHHRTQPIQHVPRRPASPQVLFLQQLNGIVIVDNKCLFDPFFGILLITGNLSLTILANLFRQWKTTTGRLTATYNMLVFAMSFLLERIMLSMNDVIVALTGTNYFFLKKPIQFHRESAAYCRTAVIVRALLWWLGNCSWHSLLLFSCRKPCGVFQFIQRQPCSLPIMDRQPIMATSLRRLYMPVFLLPVPMLENGIPP
jgi:hypothetical protein